jgi:hypothetical protein
MRATQDPRPQLDGLIAPNARVLEFGGRGMALRQHLPAGWPCTPSDLVEGEPGVRRYDLNAEQLAALPGFDVAVFDGVLEYVRDVPRLLAHLHMHCDHVVATYPVATSRGLRAKLGRRSHGWVNDYSVDELVGMFLHAGFYPCAERRWEGQMLFQFKKQQLHAAAVRDP